MSKLIRVSDKNHEDFHSIVKGLDFKDADELITVMIKDFRSTQKMKFSGIVKNSK